MLSTSVSKSVGSVLHIFYVLLTGKAVQGAVLSGSVPGLDLPLGPD